MGKSTTYTLNVELTNNTLLKAMEDKGIESLKALSSRTGIPARLLSLMSKFQLSLLDQYGHIRNEYRVLADEFDIPVYQLHDRYINEQIWYDNSHLAQGNSEILPNVDIGQIILDELKNVI